MHVNKSLTLTGVRPSDGSLVPDEPLALVTDLRYDPGEASLGWDSDRDLREPESLQHSFSENNININQSRIKAKFLLMFNESFKKKLNIKNMDEVHKKGSARLLALIGLMSTQTIKETHTALGDQGDQAMVAFFEELVLQTGTSASAMFIMVTSDKKVLTLYISQPIPIS